MQSERVDARPPPRCPLGILAECDPVWCGPLYTANVESPGLECYLWAIRTESLVVFALRPPLRDGNTATPESLRRGPWSTEMGAQYSHKT